MPKEDCWNAVGGYLRPADLLALCLGVRHSRPHTASYHGKFQLTEHACHLQKWLAHRVCLALPTVQRDTAQNHQPQALFSDDLDDLTKLLGASGKSRDLQHKNGVACLGIGNNPMVGATVSVAVAVEEALKG